MKALVHSAMLALWCSTVAVAAEMPANDYICKVQTVSVRLGVVFVQADTRAIAAEVASTALAYTVEGERERAQLTLQCIESAGESFQDKEFDNFVNSIPR